MNELDSSVTQWVVKFSLLTAANDNRVKAVFGIDPVDATGGSPGSQPSPEYPSVTPERMSDITIPIVLMGERRTPKADCSRPPVHQLITL